MKKLIPLLLIMFISCGEKETADMQTLEEYEQSQMVPSATHPQTGEIKTAIEELLTKSEGPSLILEGSEDKKFILFYSEAGKVVVDLPKIVLTPPEAIKAGTYFGKHNIVLVDVENTDPATGEKFNIKSYKTAYSSEKVDDAINIAIAALYEVFGFSDSTKLLLVKEWE